MLSSSTSTVLGTTCEGQKKIKIKLQKAGLLRF
jgi:hypothetical protein